MNLNPVRFVFDTVKQKPYYSQPHFISYMYKCLTLDHKNTYIYIYYIADKICNKYLRTSIYQHPQISTTHQIR